MLEIDLTTDQRLADLARRLSSYQEPLAEVGAFLEAKAKLRFVKQTDPSGKAWAPLRPSTLAQKKTRSILRETGVMAASIASRVNAKSVRVKPSVDYAIFHQTGTRKMPARPFMGFERGDPEAIAQIFRSYVEGR